MKKIILFSVVIAVIMSIYIPVIAYEYEPALTEIYIEIKNGGEAEIISGVNCPMPDKEKINLSDGETGSFIILFTEPGEYTYYLENINDGRDIIYDDCVFEIKIYVTDEEGELKSTVIVYRNNEKFDSGSIIKDGIPLLNSAYVLFSNHLNEEDKPTPEETTIPTSKKDEQSDVSERKNTEQINYETRNPQTGDDGKMETYLLIAILASLGLFILSLVYKADTDRIIRSGIKQR